RGRAAAAHSPQAASPSSPPPRPSQRGPDQPAVASRSAPPRPHLPPLLPELSSSSSASSLQGDRQRERLFFRHQQWRWAISAFLRSFFDFIHSLPDSMLFGENNGCSAVRGLCPAESLAITLHRVRARNLHLLETPGKIPFSLPLSVPMQCRGKLSCLFKKDACDLVLHMRVFGVFSLAKKNGLFFPQLAGCVRFQ
uniref:Uncharacterized protein n=1 Tax=Aegilops tauschii subsp. strangulata TaxID=200361 RepID=A0A453JCH8_AEGTS